MICFCFIFPLKISWFYPYTLVLYKCRIFVTVSTVPVTAVRGSTARLPCDIGGGNNDGLPRHLEKSILIGSEEKIKDSSKTIPEDRAYMVLWFKHRPQQTVRHRNSKTKNKKMSSGGKPLYRYCLVVISHVLNL